MNIILLTNGYPYKNKDGFVGNEIESVSSKFKGVYIVPIIEGSIFPKKYDLNENMIEMPKNVNIYHMKFSILNKFKFNLSDLKILFKEVASNRKNILTFEIKKSLKYMHSIIRNFLSANFIKNNIEIIIKENNLEREDTILYSYWWHESALAISLTKGNFFTRISRAHGYDLYKYRRIQVYKEFTLQKLNYIFACSKQGADYINKIYNTNKSIVSYLGTNKLNDVFVKINYNRKEVLNIVTCSNVVKVKRIDKLIDSICMVKNLNIEWTHIGDGVDFDYIKSYAQEKISKHNEAKEFNSYIRYNFIGRLENKKVKEYYENNSIDLFINTSYSEGLPVSIMEAISYGIPVIATNVGGVSEIIENGKNGFLIDEDFKYEDILKLLYYFSNLNDKAYFNMKKNCFEIWKSNFCSEYCYEKFFDFIEYN